MKYSKWGIVYNKSVNLLHFRLFNWKIFLILSGMGEMVSEDAEDWYFGYSLHYLGDCIFVYRDDRLHNQECENTKSLVCEIPWYSHPSEACSRVVG